MILPRMKETPKTRVYRRRFGGLCRLASVPDGDMTDMEGVSTGEYPAASTRQDIFFGPRFLTRCNGLFAAEKLLWADGQLLCYGGAVMPVLLTDCPKTFCQMGSGVVIFPDKVRFDTETCAVTYLENAARAEGALVDLCDEDGEAVTDYTASSGAPENPVNGMLWLDTSLPECEMKQYSEALLCWQPVSGVMVRVSAAGLGHGFRKGDCAEIAGLSRAELNGWKELAACGENFLAFAGLVPAPYTETGTVTASRTVPDMDFVCERGNRLWGCSSEAHEIYACALGDPTNWRRYQGLSTDSYAVTVGSTGTFTGCASYADETVFLKSGELLRVTGTRPANFRVTSVKAPGAAPGSGRSAAAVNEALYYLSSSGVMRLDAAGIPSDAGRSLGREAYRGGEACAAPDGRYLLCVTRESGAREVLSLDTATGLWCREAALSVSSPVRLDSCVYGVSGGRLVCLAGQPDTVYGQWEAETDRVSYFETGDLGLDTPKEKHIGRLSFRIRPEAGAVFTVFVMYDGDGVWRRAGGATSGARPVTVPVLVRRCDRMRIRAEWTGRVTVLSLSAEEEK